MTDHVDEEIISFIKKKKMKKCIWMRISAFKKFNMKVFFDTWKKNCLFFIFQTITAQSSSKSAVNNHLPSRVIDKVLTAFR